VIRLGLPKGRMQEGVFTLLAEAGIKVTAGSRGYRPSVSLPGFEAKILKPQNIVEMLHAGSRDLGFAGADWVREMKVELVELLDTRMDPVRVVAAAPTVFLEEGKLPKRHLVVASEYEQMTRQWIADEGLDASFVRSFGATEVFPPEDADIIVDNTATGSTLVANGLTIVGELMKSSTKLYANPKLLEDPEKRAQVERFVLLIRSVLEARQRVMLEVNVSGDRLEAVIGVLPSMRHPTISSLHGQAGFAVKAALLRSDLPRVIPEIKAQGGTDIVVTALAQIVP
jgi:ATP phosphoribosyltransferase